ncbi:MAG: hypothetical protein ACHREM_33245, partial [Polyangiales bacterium]
MYVQCPRCNGQNYDNATQCAHCGTPLSPTGAGAQPPPPPPFGNTNAPGFAGTSSGGPGVASG